MEDEEKPSTGSKFKIALEELDKEELVKRCKHYLSLAQRAKVAKDDSQLRENNLVTKVSSLETTIGRLECEAALREDLIAARSSENQAANAKLEDVVVQLTLKEEEITTLRTSVEIIQVKLDRVEENYEQQKNGFVEELNKMNDVLKSRGETITRLEEKNQTIEKEFKLKIETLLQSIADRERKIDQLESEISRLENQSEMMSTSTVSKTEEIHRMRDVEDSLEDRYNKLKMLAVRMKKKIAEQSLLLTEKEHQVALVVNDSNRGMTQNLQALQRDIDRLNDDLDLRKSQMAQMKKDCESAIQELVDSKQKSEEYKNEVALLKSTVATLERTENDLEKSVQELKKQLNEAIKDRESDKILRVELGKECDRLKNEICQLRASIDELNRNSYEAKQETKKQNLLQLEITDYEKTVSGLNMQLDSLRKEVKERQADAQRFEEEKTALLVQIQFLDQQVATEQNRAFELKNVYDLTKSEFQSYRDETQEQKLIILQLTEKSESQRSEIDDLRCELSQANAQLHQARTESALNLDTLRKQVSSLEGSVASEKVAKENIERRLVELQAEYENYKIRAASVLKKQKTEGHPVMLPSQETTGEFNTDQVEREMLQRVVEGLKSKIAALESHVALTQSELSSVRAERERSAVAQLASVQAMQLRTERAEVDLETAKREHQAQIVRLQDDNQLLAALHREQMEVLKLRHSQEMLAMQDAVDTAAMEAAKLQVLVAAKDNQQIRIPPAQDQLLRGGVSHTSDREREGSEDGSINDLPQHCRSNSMFANTSRKPMPLDQLLDSTLNAEESEVVEPHALTAETLVQFKESLSVSEKRCLHLSSLLAESEANEARLAQLADALKEEIRRTERAEERQKHIENLEYLKNVVLKFVTLPRGEERSRLVPVLTTLLRLSPVEVQEVHHAFGRKIDGSPARPTAWGGVFNYFAANQ